MPLVSALRASVLAPLVSLLPLAGCAGLNAYGPTAEVTQSRYTTIVNYSTERVDADRVDALLVEVAELLQVQLDPATPPPRIVVTTPDRIARLYEPGGTRFSGGLQALALYFPGRRLVMIPYFDRILLGHELAHYLTEQYVAAPLPEWEPIADRVEWRLAFGRGRGEKAAPVTRVIGRPTRTQADHP